MQIIRGAGLIWELMGRYGKCLFCDFRRDKTEIYGLPDIERQLGLLRVIEDERNRMHFLGCNPFFLSAEILGFFCELVKHYLPKITEISMYARADDINAKSDEELRMLRAAADGIICYSSRIKRARCSQI